MMNNEVSELPSQYHPKLTTPTTPKYKLLHFSSDFDEIWYVSPLETDKMKNEVKSGFGVIQHPSTTPNLPLQPPQNINFCIFHPI